MQTTSVLHIYNSSSGQVSGQFFEDGIEVFAVAGCATATEVLKAVDDAGYEKYTIVMDVPY